MIEALITSMLWNLWFHNGSYKVFGINQQFNSLFNVWCILVSKNEESMNGDFNKLSNIFHNSAWMLLEFWGLKEYLLS